MCAMSTSARRGRWLPLVVVLALLAGLLLAPAAGAIPHVAGLTGIVTDPGGLAPPAGTLVRLLRPDDTLFGQATVDPDGSFAFNLVPNGNYLLRALPPAGSGMTKSLPVPVSIAGAPVDVGTVPLTYPSLTGTVYAPDGTTPASAWIHVHTGGRLEDVTPAPGGQVAVGGLPPGSYVAEAWPMDDEPLWRSEPHTITIASGVTQTVEFTLSRADVWGTAVDSVGNPVAEAVALALNAHGEVVARDVTSRSGFFAIGGLRPGDYGLALTPPPWLPGLIPPAPVHLTIPPGQDLGDIAFGASRKVVQGQVETNTAQPVAAALITAHRLDRAGDARTLSDPAGHYALQLSEGLWALAVEPISQTVPADWLYPFGPQFAHFEHNTEPESRTVDFGVVQADSHIVGTVELPGGGTPPFTVTVHLHTDAGIGVRAAVDPADGSFDVRVPHGAYNVTVIPDDPGHLGPPVAPIRVLPNSIYHLGTLTLELRDATISGTVTTDDGPVAGVPVVASRAGAPGWAETRTGPDGGYVLAVVGGTWLASAAPEPDQPWIYPTRPLEVDVPAAGAVGGIDLSLIAADAEIAGTVVDEGGTPLTRLAGWVNAIDPANPAIQKGSPVVDGAFTVLVPGGTYRVTLNLPEETGWLAPGSQEVTVAAGSTTEMTFTVRARNATIAGALWDPRAEQTVTGVRAGVMAFGEGTWVGTAVDPGNGAYRLGVADGLWAVGYEVDPASGYVALGHRRTYPVAAGQTVIAPLPVVDKDGVIEGIVLDPSGAPLGGATVMADGLSAPLLDVHLGTLSRADGTFTLPAPHGAYLLRAAFAGSEPWLQPASRHVALPPGGAVSGVELQFLQPDAAISGTLSLADRQPITGTAFVWAYSPLSAYTHTRGRLGELYALDVISNTTWHVGAAYQEGDQYWTTREVVHVPAGGATLDLVLDGPFPLPGPVTVVFDAAQEQYVTLADGTTLYIPAGAMPVSGTVTLHITPIVTVPHQRHAHVYRYAYAFTALDDSGQPIEEQFNHDVLITFGYDEAELRRQGISEQWLKPAYFSTTTNTWAFPPTFVVDTVANRVAMQIDHFTDFALTGSEGYRVYVPLIVH